MLVSFGARAASQWVLVLLFAYSGGTAAVGEFALALAVTTPIFILAEGGLRNLYLSLADKYTFRTYFVLRLLGVGLAVAAAVATAAAIGDIDYAFVLAPLLIIKAVDSILDLLLVTRQAVSQFVVVGAGGLLNASVTVLLGWLALAIFETAQFILWGSAAGSLITLLAFARPHSGMRTDGSSSATRLLRRSLPLGLAIGVNSLIAYLPVLFLNSFADIDSAGRYAASAYAITFGNLILSAIQQGVMPPLVQRYRSNQQLSRSDILFGLLAVAAPGLILTAVTGIFLSPMLPLVYGSEFVLTTGEGIVIAACILAVSVNYACSLFLLIVNAYLAQLSAALLSLCIALGLLGLLHADASLLTASFIALGGYSARALLAAVMAIKALSNDATQEDA